MLSPEARWQIAIERIRQFEPKDGYYLAFSGGKDSCTVKHLCQLAGVKFDAHYALTTIDPPELVHFIQRQHPDVKRHRPEKSLQQLILEHRWPPTRQQRWCCEGLKEEGGSGRVVLTGIRWQESAKRKKRRMYERCEKKDKTIVSPIIDWKANDVWDFLNSHAVPHCVLYDQGWKRVGCLLCPMAHNDRIRQAALYPKVAARFVRMFDRLIEFRSSIGLATTQATGQELFDWWISEKAGTKDAEGQCYLYE